MNLSTIVNRIRDHDGALLGQNVGAAAEQAAAMEECFIDGTYEGPLPLAFVIGGPDIVGENSRDGGSEQVLVENFAVMVAIDARADKEGLVAYEQVDPIRSELWAGILGWQPTGYSYPIEYAGSEIVELNRAFLNVVFQFRVTKIFDEQSGVDMEEIYGPFCAFQKFWGDVVATHTLTGAVDFTTAEPAPTVCGTVYMSTIAGTSNITATSVLAWTMYSWNGTGWDMRPWDIVAQVGFTDTFVPLSVEITDPTGSGAYCTALSTVDLAGLAAGTELGAVTWSNAGTMCAGTASLCAGAWSALGVALCAGANLITVTANSADGSYRRRARITVTQAGSPPVVWTPLYTYDGLLSSLGGSTFIAPYEEIFNLTNDAAAWRLRAAVAGARYQTGDGLRIVAEQVAGGIGGVTVARKAIFPTPPTAFRLVWTGRVHKTDTAQSGLHFGFSVDSPCRYSNITFIGASLLSPGGGFEIQVQKSPFGTGGTGPTDSDVWGAINPTFEHEYSLTATATSVTLEIDGFQVAEILAAAVFSALGVTLASIIAGIQYEWSDLDMRSAPVTGEGEATIRSTASYYQL